MLHLFDRSKLHFQGCSHMLNMYTAIAWLIGDNDILIYLLIMYSKTLNLLFKNCSVLEFLNQS